VFRIDFPPDPARLPLFAEFARFDRVTVRPSAELVSLSRALLERHLRRRPKVNPFQSFKTRFRDDLEWLKGEGLPTYHTYAFAGVRQFGANFELASLYFRWLSEHGESNLDDAAEAFASISGGAKALILKAARAVAAKKPADFGPTFEEMEAAWSRAMGIVESRYLK